ncbi:PIN domain-containing protein [uncultured Pseudosulfitobacter sp.]|uniref:RSP_2648 family PIN domain-containing protein n=1 Tax=uncultured Pseudosulfitobacter sp. TaxID=2854214 RepID=UPI0030D90FC7|tara:strand:+ start:951 stop:1490 length:540 start_codon:yes stop_codon:yes gene_type:complete
MKILIDACVLYPTVMREMVLGVASAGVFEPQWSPRLLEEWARAAARLGSEGEAQARGEIALLQAAWPRASVTPQAGLLQRLWLPDENDIHVLGAAIAGSSDVIMTLNAKDFPRNILAEEGLSRIDPDGYLHQVWQNQPEVVQDVGEYVLKQARAMSGTDWTMRALMKKARLPRIGKALG